MSKFPHPLALEALILYDIEKWRTADRSYRNLCNMIGEKAISEEDFDDLYRKMIKEKTHPLDLRLCILSDVIEKKPIDKSFKDISEMVGSIDYQDFEFWFDRFSTGNWSLDQKTFSDLPIEIVRNIVEYSDIMSQVKLRKVFSGLRNIVNQLRPSVNFIEFGLTNPRTIGFICHVKHRNPCPVINYTGKNREERAFSDMEILLKNPRLRLEYFYWINDSLIDQKLEDLLNSLNHQLEIGLLFVHTTNEDLMIDLLKAVKPGTLKELVVYGIPEKSIDFDRLSGLIQWKQAKKFKFDKSFLDFSSNFHHFHHFEKFTINVDSITLDDLLEMKMVFSSNSNFKRCDIHTKKPMRIQLISETLGFTFDSTHSLFYERYGIPGSNDYLLFEIIWLALRRVSRGLRSIVDQVRPSIDSLAYNFNSRRQVQIHAKYIFRYPMNFRKDFKEREFNDIKIFLRNPRLRLEWLEWDNGTSSDDQKLIELLDSLNHQLKIKYLVMMSLRENAMVALLKAMKPGILEEITINSVTAIDQLAALDQWKQAKSVEIRGVYSDFFRHFHHFHHFETLKVRVESISMDDILNMRNVFSEKVNFKECFIETRNDPPTTVIAEQLGLTNNQDRRFPKRYNIPGSNDCLLFNVNYCEVNIMAEYLHNLLGILNLNQKTFNDLPVKNIVEIIEYLDFKERMTLRKVSRDLRKIVDDMKPLVDRIFYTYGFQQSDSGFIVRLTCHTTDRKSFSCFSDMKKLKYSFNNIEILLRNPQLQLDYFEWSNLYLQEDNQKMIDLFTSLNHQLKIRELELGHIQDNALIALLKAVEPGTLEEINLKFACDPMNFDRIYELDQWKQAKRVKIHSDFPKLFATFHHFHHFETLNVHVEWLSTDNLLIMRNVFSENVNFKDCFVKTGSELKSKQKRVIAEQLGLTNNPGRRFPKRYDIPGSNDCLLFEAKYDGINIVRRESIDNLINLWLTLRKVSSGLRSIVDQVRPSIEYLEYDSDYQMPVVIYTTYFYCCPEKLFTEKDCKERAFNDMAIFFEKSQTSIGMVFSENVDFKKCSIGARNKPPKTVIEKRLGLYNNPVKNPASIFSKQCDIPGSEDCLLFDIHCYGVMIVRRKSTGNRNPKLRLEYLKWDNDRSSEDQKLIDLLDSLDHQLEIKQLVMFSLKKEAAVALLKAMKPGILEEITTTTEISMTSIDRLAELDQWKQAKYVVIHGLYSNFSRHFHHFHHFETLKVRVESISLDDLLNMRNVFSKNISFKECSIETRNKPPRTVIEEQLGLYDSPASISSNRFTKQCDIPEFTDYRMAENLQNRLGSLNLNQKTFNDLPVETIVEIIEYLDFKAQLSLRRVSRGLRNIVDDMRPLVDGLSYTSEFADDDGIFFMLFFFRMKRNSGYWFNSMSYNGSKCNKNGLDILEILLRNPRLRLEYFEWCGQRSSEDDERLVDLLISLNRKLKITELKLGYSNEDVIFNILKAVEPGTLEEIHIQYLWDFTRFDRFAELDQWKQAKYVTINAVCFDFSLNFHHFHHFESLFFDIGSISVDDILIMRNVFLKNVNFHDCSIEVYRTRLWAKTIKKQLGLSDVPINYPTSSYFGRYDIPDSNDYLRYEIKHLGINVTRESADSL
uniref:F-box domain-containing protein n=1 Tax=Caenorhabditis tropicalis TaxID=1561998 RepID=A0A1I7UI98_9PELO